jgi:ABC-2 type transport system ATP-binding protein
MTDGGSTPAPVAAASTPMIDVDRVTRTFGKVEALRGVSLAVPEGTVCALLGHNGAGKTTLVNILATLTAPTSGTARIAGLDVTRDGAVLRGRIGLTGQFASVDDRMTVFRNLVLIGRLLGASRKAARDRADELLTAFGLVDAAGRPAATYSGGMRRRLDLAASLVGQPDVIFLDEPTTGLDPATRIAMWAMVEQLVREGTTVLLTTQYLDEADQLADQVVLLSHGSVVASGTPAELKAQTGKRTITVTLANDGDTTSAVAALRDAGLTPLTTDTDARVLTMAVQRSTELALVLRTLDGAEVDPVELSLVEPRLDDVYLQLSET